jgi:dihydroorotate dehydrogenase (NAD+) catalytic subunit
MPDLSVKIAGLNFKNPVIAASGVFGYGREYADIYDLAVLGGIAVKGTTTKPCRGNKPPRIAETSAGILNSVGLQNPGIDKVIEEEMSFLKYYDTIKIVNIAGHSMEEYVEMAAKLQGVAGVDALEINISCPNIKNGGMIFGADPKSASAVIKAVREVSSLPLIAKLTPNVTDISEIALAAEYAGADAVSLINTILGMAVNYKTRRPVLNSVFGGLSGPAVKPVALRMVWQVYNAVKIPIIGMGGIQKYTDIIEFMLAGAAAVQIGTANFINPMLCPEIIEDLRSWLEKEKIPSVSDLRGALETV